MRVAPDDLGADSAVHVRQVELARFGRELGVQDDLQEHVTKLLRKIRRGAALDRVDGLVGLLEQIAAQAGVGLAAVPWTAVRGPQASADGGHAVW